MKFLSVDAILFTDGGGKVQALAQPVHGLTRISNLMMTYFNKFPVDFTYRITMVNGLPGIVIFVEEKTSAVISFDILDGQIVNLYFVVNPDKLTHAH